LVKRSEALYPNSYISVILVALSNETEYLMKRVFFLLFLLYLPFTNSFSQARLENRNTFFQAENFVLYEEYKEALPLYMQLVRIYPNNYNFRYRIGQCLINLPGRKSEAISYLEDAVKHIDPKYKEGRFKEENAPYDSYYYLANAYRINNQLTKALATYELFKQNLDPKIYDTAVVKLQIESCLNAQQLMKSKLFVKKVNLGEVINDRFPDTNPVVSEDENILVYNKAGQLQDFVFFSKKIDGKWTTPIDIIPDFGIGNEEKNFATSLSADGRELYLYRPGNDYDGNIFVTRRNSEDRWSNLVKLNDNINTKYWESHASISHDGKKLYFTSNRKGGYGGLDIYVSDRDSTGDWGPAINLGPIINTKYNEESPFLGKDDKTLFFSSSGHYNMGGYDIFYSTLLENGQWSVPMNIGYPLNTTDDDLFFVPVKDDYQAYYSLDDSDSYGDQDIYRIELFSKEHPRKFIVRGIVQVKDLKAMLGDSVKISAFNTEDPNASVVVYSNPKTGEYKFELQQGSYEIKYEAEGAEKTVSRIDIPLTNPVDSFVLPGTTLPKTDFTADMIIYGNKTISVTTGDTVSIPMKVEPNSLLTVEHWLGESLISTEKLIIKNDSLVYKVVPLMGDNRMVFTLADKFNNTTSSEILIKRSRVVTKVPVASPEYNRVIAKKQTDAFVKMLKNRADEDLRKVIENSDIEKQKFGRVDDIISYVKEEAAKSNISPDKVDKLALIVAVRDNVLTQAAVDYMAHNTTGEIKDLLTGLNIYDAGLKTWIDLQNYISKKTNGRIKPEDLNKIAADVLNGVDPIISKLRAKIIAFSDNFAKGKLLKISITIADSRNIRTASQWLQSVYNESVTSTLTDKEMANMLSVISSMPGTDTKKYIEDISQYSDETLKNYLNSPAAKKSGYPRDLLLELLRNKDKGSFTGMSMFQALAKLINAEDIPEDTIRSQAAVEISEINRLWILWLVLGGVLIIFFIIFFSRRKKKENKE
jgi:tetratricopeptide (TPR) repeat protein